MSGLEKYSLILRYYYQYCTIPKENLVGTFGIKKGAVAPFFLKGGGNGPLFEELQPPYGKKGGGKGGSMALPN